MEYIMRLWCLRSEDSLFLCFNGAGENKGQNWSLDEIIILAQAKALKEAVWAA